MAQSALSAPLKLKNSMATTIPKLLYGTAWKKDRTAELVYQALKAGFRGIDTAAQPRHYRENLVGDGIKRAIQEGLVTRNELYIQTKFTPLSGQDLDNMPYLQSQSLEDRIHSSIASSLTNLQTDTPENSYIDCLVLHSPLPTYAETEKAWQIFSSYVPHKIRALGISNTSFSILKSLHTDMDVKPSVVQNRFHEATKWEVAIRKFCRVNQIVFQSFWTYTGNPKLMQTKPVKELNIELQQQGIENDEVQTIYALVAGLEGITILDGTRNPERMKADLKGLQKVGSWAENEGKEKWTRLLSEFKAIIGEDQKPHSQESYLIRKILV